MRLIDADALLKEINDYPYGYRGMIKDTIAKQPTVDAVEVIRCKDCRWFEYDGYHTNCKIMRFCVEAEDYCSRGERRKDETN